MPPNFLKALATAMKSFTEGDTNAPLHVGEVMSCWTYYAFLSDAITLEQITQNMTTDQEMLTLLKDAENVCAGQANKLGKFMVDEGIPLPPTLEKKPKTDPNAVPQGAKETDFEIAQSLSLKIALAAVQCATAASTSIRTDVGMMFVNFQLEQMTYSTSLKNTMAKRGWLRIPPPYHPPGKPDKQ
jgi:hypothetical protein